MLQRRFYTFLSVPVFIYLYAYTAVIVFLILIQAYLKWKRGIRVVAGFWAKTVFPLMGKRLYIEGKKNIVKGEKYILLANHASMFDIIAIMAFYPSATWFGHERLLRIPLFKQMLLMTDYIPMKMSNVTTTRQMILNLQEKARFNTVVIFPEGTRTLNGKLNPFYRGFVHLLRVTGNQILPVTLNGFYKLKPKNRFYINFGSKLGVVIHQPIEGECLISASDQEIMKRITEVIESANTDFD
jgi:1-acyl-sn-glycerol-3-phosphate acyltransferase